MEEDRQNYAVKRANVRAYEQRFPNIKREVRYEQQPRVVCNVAATEFLHIARGLLDRVYTRWSNNKTPIGILDVDSVVVQDNAVLIPDGTSRDYLGRTRNFIVQVFGSSHWPERDDFLQRLGTCRGEGPSRQLEQFDRLYFHPFLQNAQDRALFLVNFCETYRDNDTTFTCKGGKPTSWRTKYNDWEEKRHPPIKPIDLSATCGLVSHALSVFNYRAPRGTYKKTDRSSKVVLARNIITHVNSFRKKDKDKNNTTLSEYDLEQKLALIEYLFPNITQLVYHFCLDFNLKVDIHEWRNYTKYPST